MEITNLVQASADVVTITRLRKGDVYKRVETPSYGGTKLMVGVVTSVMNNGNDAAVTALEFSDGYGEHRPTQKIFSAGTEAALFRAEPVEVSAVMDRVNASAQAEVDRKRRELAESEKTLELVDDIIRHAVTGGLSAPQISAPTN